MHIRTLEGNPNWLNWRNRMTIIVRSLGDALEVVEGRLKRPEPLRNDASQNESYLRKQEKGLEMQIASYAGHFNQHGIDL